MTDEIGIWFFREWVICDLCELEQPHPEGAESRDEFKCARCGVTLRWTDEYKTPKGTKICLWRVIE